MSDEVVVSHVSFGENVVEIGYAEGRNQSERVMKHETLVFDRSLAEQDVKDLLGQIEYLIDKVEPLLRDAPATKPLNR